MELDPKALEAANKAYSEDPKVWLNQHPNWLEQRTKATDAVKAAIHAYLDAADLVPRSELNRRDRLGTAELDGMAARGDGKSVKDNPHPKLSDEAEMWSIGWHDEDVSRRHITERDEALSLTETQGRQLAALREAIMSLRGHAFATEADQQLVEPLFLALTDTAAAAQYQRVPEGWRLVHIAAHERAMDYREAAESGIGLARVELQRGDAKAALAHLDFYCKKMEIADEAMLAAAPKAGEPQSEDVKLCDPAFPYDDLKGR